jgi:hypothetical protein
VTEDGFAFRVDFDLRPEGTRGPLVNSFIRSNELLDALMSKARMPSEGGSLIERSFAGGAPARGVGVFVGDELLNMTRRQQTKRFQVEPHRIVAAINIPKKELLFNSGKLAVIRLIEEYPQTTLEGAKADLNSFLLTGVSRGLVFQTADLAGFLSLNGDFAAGSGTGVTNGLLDFQAITAQSQVVQNVAKSSSYSHFNQFGSIVKFADLLILIFMKVASSAPISAYASTLFFPPTSIIVMVSSALNSTAHLFLRCFSRPPTSEFV